MSSAQCWWKQPLRVIQTNLQVKDTPKMNPEKIAEDMQQMGANALVMNVGGIYAWYPSRLEYHTVNPFLPKDYDLLSDVIAACHKRGIRFIARFDFSKVSDRVYQRHPTWFHRQSDGAPEIIGATRPGEWDLLYSTCINGDYRNKAAVHILKEALSSYDIDGVFFNAPHPTNCHCQRCQEKYLRLYGVPMPEDTKAWAPDWRSRCLRDNIGILRQAIREIREDVPAILYYSIAADNLYDRLATCDMICAEPQDVLSLGWKEIPQSFKPALCIRLGCSELDIPRPFGIIHSCPGMDWRHTGLPPAEYLYWMSQVPANGGQIWHSITGFPDTISDKRILDCVSTINHQIAKVENIMHGASSNAKVALLWDMHIGSQDKAFGGLLETPANGWAEAMLNSQIPFDMILPEQILQGRLSQYQVLVAPCGLQGDAIQKKVSAFAELGGCVITQCWKTPDAGEAALMGVEPETQYSEYLQASYLRFEENGAMLQKGLERTPLLPHRGRTIYMTPVADTKTLCTLVPPFAPMEAVGAPPERATIAMPHTDIPLALEHSLGEGKVLTVPYALSNLESELKLNEHVLLMANMIQYGLGDALDIHTTPLRGIQLMDYRKEAIRVVHLVNGIGQRPLSQNLPVPIRLTLDWKVGKRPRVHSLLSEQPGVTLKNGKLIIDTAPVITWDVLTIETEE